VFDEQDYQREWYVTAHAGNHAASMTVNSAYVTVTTAEDVVSHLAKMIHELETESCRD
jgi:hypothetical protein